MEQPLAEPPPTPPTDAALVPGEQPARPDHAAFEQVMREYNQRLFRLAFGLVGDAAEAEDVLQDSYLRAFQRLASFTGRSGLGAWLASIVRNQAIDHLRARQARQALVSLEADLPFGQGGSDSALDRFAAPESQSSLELDRAREETREALELAIATLPAPFRAVFLLRGVEGLSLEETAEYLAIPVATVKTRDHRARLLLRAELGPAFDVSVDGVFEFLRERCDWIVARVRARLTFA
jgi:RNA polymerase sigma-70 factor (ECF subfamily)